MRSVDPMVNALANPVTAAPRGASGDQRASTRARGGEEPRRASDSIELSDAARSRLTSEDQPIRSELVNRVRAEIASGKYETNDKLDVVIDRLHRDLFGA